MDSNSRIKAVVSNTSTLSISIVVQPAPSTPNMPNRPSKPPPTSDNHHRPNTSKQEYEVPIVAQPENYIAQDVEFYNAPKFSDMINAETNIAVVGKSEFKFQAVSQFTTPTAIPIVPNNIKVPQPTTPTSILIVPNNPKKTCLRRFRRKKKERQRLLSFITQGCRRIYFSLDPRPHDYSFYLHPQLPSKHEIHCVRPLRREYYLGPGAQYCWD